MAVGTAYLFKYFERYQSSVRSCIVHCAADKRGAKMKKVVLLGDSIRLIGYGKKVEEMLRPEYEVWQPEDNCRFAKYGLNTISTIILCVGGGTLGGMLS